MLFSRFNRAVRVAWLLSCCVLIESSAAAPSADDDGLATEDNAPPVQRPNPFEKLTARDIDSLSAQLKNKTTRGAALAKLIPIASSELYKTSSMMTLMSADRQALTDRAVKALIPYFDDDETIAMTSPDRDVRYWALRFAPRNVSKNNYKEVISQSLVGPLRQVAACDESAFRQMSLELLREMPGQESFVAERIKQEQDPSVYSIFIKDDGEFNKKLQQSLTSGDMAKRLDALMFIGTNGGSTAKMFWRNFDAATLSAALLRKDSPSAKERGRVAFALPMLVDVDKAKVKSGLISMTKDPVSGVRWRAAIGLQDLLDTPEAKKVVEALLHDPDPQVVRFADMVLNPKPRAPNMAPQQRGRARGSIEQ